MDVNVMQMALEALIALGEPQRMGFLILGVGCGLILGAVPGLGGLVGLSLLLPFTFSMDPYTAMAFLMGLTAVTATSDAITSVLFGLPGTASTATVLDGYPMTRRGEAGRALGAAFTASVVGGIFGAFVLLLLIPLLRPAVLSIARPEMLAITIFGISLAAALAGKSQIRGLLVACIGLTFAMVGQSRAGEFRWTFDTFYLFDGMHIIPITLGLFALPEIADIIIQKTSIARDVKTAKVTIRAQFEGVKDVLRNWFLVLRCSGLGAAMGAIPGIGAPVIDWIAYGHAARTCKGASETFGTGDVRGVIAAESSNNAKDGGSLVPTIAFGIPGSASMAIILAALLTQGVVPGPEMLTTRLDLTYTLVWSVAVANIFGAGVCILFANQFAKIALVRISLLGPIVLVIVFLGAFQGKYDWGDIYTFLFFGVLGFIMKRMGWPRPPLILGVVLGSILEANAFIAANVYGWDWVTRPITAILLFLTFIGLARPLFGPIFKWLKVRKTTTTRVLFNGTTFSKPQMLMAIAVGAFFTYAYVSSLAWGFRTALMPQSVAIVGLVLTTLLILSILFRIEVTDAQGNRVLDAKGLHMDIGFTFEGIDRATFFKRLGSLVAWCAGLVVMAQLIGLLPACALFLFGYLRFREGESWKTTLVTSTVVIGGIYILFHLVLRISWAPAWIGYVFPALRSNPWLSLV